MCLKSRLNCQDESIVNDLIKRKRREKMNVRDKNFPDLPDLEVYKCWDATEWEDTDMGSEELHVKLDCDVDARELMQQYDQIFRPDSGLECVAVHDGKGTGRGTKRRGRGSVVQPGPPLLESASSGGPSPGSASSAGTSPTPGTPGSTPRPPGRVPCPLRTARASAAKMISQIGGLLQDVASWPAKLTAAAVPSELVAAMTKTSTEWDAKLEA